MNIERTNSFSYSPLPLTNYQLLVEPTQAHQIGSKLLLVQSPPQSETHLGQHWHNFYILFVQEETKVIDERQSIAK